jgi:hypothetical protein
MSGEKLARGLILVVALLLLCDRLISAAEHGEMVKYAAVFAVCMVAALLVSRRKK